MDFRVLMMGDAAFTIEYTDLKGTVGAKQVRALRSKVQASIGTGEIAGVVDMISTSRSLTVCLTPAYAGFETVRQQVCDLAGTVADDASQQGRTWTLPVCYEGELAPDLTEVAERAGLTAQEVINIHSGTAYSILMIGFLPGFPFMAEIDPRLRFPRRESPRTRVPAGSVAIANDQTAIYPWESPGGWHLLGRCPVALFDADQAVPSLLQAGETVCFEPVSRADFDRIEQDLKQGTLLPDSFLKGGE
ncbi:5-oxoprolinase subunit PxpB [Terasakiella pusilla]|uniref:5-oxoprolinase subunit PxpB n=1 Tax=Terasakiella pusilla TaxID=64973 RepID=UPI003AA7BF40